MRPAEKLYPCHETMFSPPFLMSRPAPSPRSAHATRLVTSKPVTSSCGRIWAWMHLTSASLLLTSASQLPVGPGVGVGDGDGAGAAGVRNVCVPAQALVVSPSPERT